MLPRPRGLLRLLARSPIFLYRLGLGWLLGRRFLLLTHRGLRSGRPRRAVLEVVRYDPRTRESVVVAAWGERSDWYRNLQAGLALEVQTGRQRYLPEQRFLTPAEVEAELADYARRHPLSARIMARLLGLPPGDTVESRRAAAAAVRMVAFRPRRPP